MKDFEKLSYRGQVKRLRQLAENALKNYPVRWHRLEFIHHGENTTFRAHTEKSSFLLRVHRIGYHTKAALQEELDWLSRLSMDQEITVQKPIRSKAGEWIIPEALEGVPGTRNCDLLVWQDGLMKFKTVTERDLFYLGVLTGRLHRNGKRFKSRLRKYWGPEGLIGKDAKLGSVLPLKEFLGRDYRFIEKCRLKTIDKLSNYSAKRPEKLGMIHADLHFGNLVWQGSEPIPIDFDDCGEGIQMYDLAVTLYSLRSNLQRSGRRDFEPLKNALLQGYSFENDINGADLEAIEDLMVARRIMILGWLYSRKDNPLLFDHFKSSYKTHLKAFKELA